MGTQAYKSDEALKRIGEFYGRYTRGMTPEDIDRLLRKETREVYRFFVADTDREVLQQKPPVERALLAVKHLFLGFVFRLSPVRRLIYTLALASFGAGLYWIATGAAGSVYWVAASFILVNFLLALELADKLTLKGDLLIARRIQFTLLPKGGYRREGVIDVQAGTIPANTVGGDYYDILELEDGKLGLAIGDVSGKGIPAALLMAYLQASLRALSAGESSPIASLLERINRHIHSNTPSNKLITFFYAVYDPSTCRLSYSNAGHNRPMVLSREGGIRELDRGGLPLGVSPAASFEVETIQLHPGDALFLYTDGVTEAENEQGQEFGTDRLRTFLRRNGQASPERLTKLVLDEVKSFAGDNRFRDDLTMLSARIETTGALTPPAPPAH